MDAAVPKLKRARRDPAPTTPDPIEIAMEAEASGRAPTGQASLLLADHRRLIGWQIASERAGVALKFLTGAAGLVVAVALALMAWSASRADGLVIKPFSVPPALAERGITGEVVASQLLDRLSDISATSKSSAAEATLTAEWGQDVSIEIPETGVSLSQIEQWMREKLGHRRRLTGELLLDPDGRVVLTVRSGARALAAHTGDVRELPQLLVQTAEALYRRENPTTYVQYLFQMQRWSEGAQASAEMADNPDPFIRAYGLGSLAIASSNAGNDALAAAQGRAADAEGAGLSWPANNLALLEARKGRLERALQLYRRALSLIGGDPGFTAQARNEFRLTVEQSVGDLQRDHATALRQTLAVSRGDNLGGSGSRESLRVQVAYAKAAAHDGRDAEAATAAFVPRAGLDGRIKAMTHMNLALLREDWPALLERVPIAVVARGGAPEDWPDWARWRSGLALAKLGRSAEAEELLAPTPLDCQPCVTTRAWAAEAAGRRTLADHWFLQASLMAPSLPQGPLAFGQALLMRGDAEKAAVQFEEAHRRSPRAEEALLGWGEALLASKDPKAAAAKFTEAAKLTPRWGRLHLKWGEALIRQGEAAKASAQFAQAAALDLTSAERAELQGAKKRTR